MPPALLNGKLSGEGNGTQLKVRTKVNKLGVGLVLHSILLIIGVIISAIGGSHGRQRSLKGKLRGALG